MMKNGCAAHSLHMSLTNGNALRLSNCQESHPWCLPASVSSKALDGQLAACNKAQLSQYKAGTDLSRPHGLVAQVSWTMSCS